MTRPSALEVCERRTGRVLAQPFGEAIRRAVGRERQRNLILFQLLEMPDTPEIRRVQAVGRERGEGGLAAALELDERLYRLIDPERRGVAEGRGAQAPLGRERPPAGQGRLTVQADIDREEREGAGEIAPREGGRRQRQCRQQHPESRLLHHVADSSAGILKGRSKERPLRTSCSRDGLKSVPYEYRVGHGFQAVPITVRLKPDTTYEGECPSLYWCHAIEQEIES